MILPYGGKVGRCRLPLIRPIPESELDRLTLANSMILSPQGYLSKNSLDIAIKLSISFVSYETTEVEKEHLQRTSSKLTTS